MRYEDSQELTEEAKQERYEQRYIPRIDPRDPDYIGPEDEEFKDMTIEATVYGFDENTWECLATMSSNPVRIDPFVTSLWDWDSRMNLIGTWKFEGFWSEAGSFLPSRVLRVDEMEDEEE